MAAKQERVERREVYYQGVVQGVGFRYTTQRIASRFAVAGYVKNLPDGRVLVVVEGTPEEINRFLVEVQARMRQYIHAIQQSAHPASGEFRQFEILL